MEISVQDFKGISSLTDFSLDTINVMAGANSGGKSSLIHLLLLIKQSLEARSQETPLKLNKPYVSLGRFESIVRKHSQNKGFSFSLFLEKEDLVPRLFSIFSGRLRIPSKKGTPRGIVGFRGVRLSVEFRKPGDRIVVNRFNLVIEADHPLKMTLVREGHGKSYRLTCNAMDYLYGYYFEHPLDNSHYAEIVNARCTVGFFSFFPNSIDMIDGLEFPQGSYYGSQIIDLLRTSVSTFFSRISYIGPLRDEPREFYYQDDDFVDQIGNRGENAAFILAKHAEDETTYKIMGAGQDGELTISETTGTLLDAVKYWLCDVFGLARDVNVKRAKTNRNLYTVGLTNNTGTTIPITHVGFGISQVFPILIEGLRPTSYRRLIIMEQPEIHLHPRVQAQLFDFINLADDSISFLIETHSDHFINRLRRRIAESHDEGISEKVNVTFVNRDESSVKYNRLSISDIGTLDYWPEGFFDQFDDDLRALVKAQAKKRRRTAQ